MVGAAAGPAASLQPGHLVAPCRPSGPFDVVSPGALGQEAVNAKRDRDLGPSIRLDAGPTVRGSQSEAGSVESSESALQLEAGEAGHLLQLLKPGRTLRRQLSVGTSRSSPQTPRRAEHIVSERPQAQAQGSDPPGPQGSRRGRGGRGAHGCLCPLWFVCFCGEAFGEPVPCSVDALSISDLDEPSALRVVLDVGGGEGLEGIRA